MANENELLIKINADAKSAVKAFDDIRAKTEDLEGVLNKIALGAGVGFAALTAEIGLSVHAFAEAEAASRALAQSLQTQGIATAQVTITNEKGEQQVVGLTEAYRQYAEQVQAVTGIDDDQITKAQAVLQGYIGQTKITKELTQAIADLSTKTGDTNSAATLIGRTIGSNVNAFARYGLEISDTATKQERLSKVVDFVNEKFRGQAAAANQGLGSIEGLQTAFGNFQEAIGQRFAPVITAAIGGLTKFFQILTNNQEIVSLAVAILSVGTAVTGAITAFSALSKALLIARAAAVAFGIGANLATGGIVAGIGLLIGAVFALVNDWDGSLKRMTAIAQGFATAITGIFASVGKVLDGVFNFNVDRIKEGLNDVKNAIAQGYKEATVTIVKETQNAEVKQDEILAQGAEKRRKREEDEAKRRLQLRKAETELLKLQVNNEIQAEIDLKTKEIEVLKQLESNKNEEQRALLQQKYEQIRQLEDDQRAQDVERRNIFAEEDAAAAQELNQLKIDQDKVLRAQDLQALQADIETQKEVERKVAIEKIQNNIKAANQAKEDRIKYGVVIAEVNKKINSDEVKGVEQATSNLVALQQSRNSTLKTIGKAAAIAQITISTAKAAVNIYEGFSVIPIVGPALGIAGAAAAIAFGAEQIGNVVAAADGGLLTGGIPGKDSIPMLGMEGELVTPRKNFDEVVNAVADSRKGGPQEQTALLQSIDDKLSQPSQTIIQGDVLADSAFVDLLVTKINDRIRYGNARFAT